jgi:hypothetical protein
VSPGTKSAFVSKSVDDTFVKSVSFSTPGDIHSRPSRFSVNAGCGPVATREPPVAGNRPRAPPSGGRGRAPRRKRVTGQVGVGPRAAVRRVGQLRAKRAKCE